MERERLLIEILKAVEEKRYTAICHDKPLNPQPLPREWDILDVKDVLAFVSQIFG